MDASWHLRSRLKSVWKSLNIFERRPCINCNDCMVTVSRKYVDHASSLLQLAYAWVYSVTDFIWQFLSVSALSCLMQLPDLPMQSATFVRKSVRKQSRRINRSVISHEYYTITPSCHRWCERKCKNDRPGSTFKSRESWAVFVLQNLTDIMIAFCMTKTNRLSQQSRPIMMFYSRKLNIIQNYMSYLFEY